MGYLFVILGRGPEAEECKKEELSTFTSLLFAMERDGET